jgi:glucan phosphoethanolaminetransferase (alkaline phosphatase superfamily)
MTDDPTPHEPRAHQPIVHPPTTHQAQPVPNPRKRTLTIAFGFMLIAWPLAFDQTVLAPLFNPRAPTQGEVAATNLIGTSILVGAAILAVGIRLVGRPKRPRDIINAILSAVLLAIAFFAGYIFTQLSHYGQY